MGSIDIHAGDWKTGNHSSYGEFVGLSLALDEMGWTGWKMDNVPVSEIETLDIATEENVKKVAGTVGWGVAGAAILGPVGLLAGLLVGGNKKKVTFVLKLKDGRKILASTDSKTFTKMQAAIF